MTDEKGAISNLYCHLYYVHIELYCFSCAFTNYVSCALYAIMQYTQLTASSILECFIIKHIIKHEIEYTTWTR